MPGDTTMLHLQNADERDDWGVPLIRTYSPERARMGTDTDNVYPAIGPVKGGSTRMPGDTTMLHLQNADERDDCGVPMERSHIADERDDWGVPRIRTYSPERARMGTDTDRVYPPIVPVEGVCIFCSVTSYSTSSRGSISEHHVSACMTCNNCSSKFCITCINELVDSIEGFNSIPQTVKRCDATYRKIIQIQKEINLAFRTTDFGPCCLFRVIDTTSTLVKN